jgi:thiol-disulfide isomerase/thioredoxin
MAINTKGKLSSLGVRGLLLLLFLMALVLIWAFFGSQFRHNFAVRLMLRAQSPSDEAFEALAGEMPDPVDFLRACWATGKVPHRQLVASFLKKEASAAPGWLPQAENLVLEGTKDADFSVRELALATMQLRQDPRLFEQARAQLTDIDPFARQLGLDYLRTLDAQRGVPVVIPLLDDLNLQVVTRAEAALMHWTGQDFGVRVRLAIHPTEGSRDTTAEKLDELRIRDGVVHRKQWWSEHAKEFAVPAPISALPSQPSTSPVQDFTLRSVSGQSVGLSAFAGKVVVLNFWATWCTACLQEIPDLIALHQKMDQRVAVVGVALDGLPDEHHHEGKEASEAEEHSEGKSMQEIRKKVLRAVKAQGIDYPVLLDPTGSVGGRFNGGELPTTVILDPTGRVRRRFIGERSLAVFEAMVEEAGKPQL